MANQEFVSFRPADNDQSVHSEHFFRKDKVNYFGVTERNKGSDNHHFDVRITYETSDASYDTFRILTSDTSAFDRFRDQMLHHPQETQFVHRDTLELTEGVNALYHWLRDVETPPANWDFKLEPRIREYDPMIFKCTHSYNHGSSFEVMFRIDSDSFQFANVVNIYPMYDIQFDNETYNMFLAQFVADVIKPYAKASNITYRYTGDLRTSQDVGDRPGIPEVTQAEPEQPEEEPAFVTRDCLEITEDAEEFFKWLHGKFFNGEKIGCWTFKAVPGTYDEDFIVCHKTNTATSPADVHISFRNHFKNARVCGIVVNDHYTPDDVGFNFILGEFFRDIVKPYADNHKITYSYAGTLSGTNAPVNTETLDTLKFTEGAAGFYGLLLTKEHFKDTSNWSVSRCLGDQFKCDFDDLKGGEESFSVYVQFKSDASYGAVTTVGATGNLSPEQYNRHLKRFVDEMVKPYAEIQKLTYEYSGKC